MSRNWIIAIAVLVVVLVGWYLIQSQSTTKAPQVTSTPSSTESATPQATEEADVKEENMVTITSSGFSPQNITITMGESVNWMNEDREDHQVNSVPHPIHTAYSPLNTVGLLKSGEKKSLTFPEAGTYKYHNHLNPSLTGSVTVQ